jgi:hypothetical protein
MDMDMWKLLGAVGVALLAIGGLIGWAVKLIIPKMLEAFDKRSDALNNVYIETANAVKLIPVAINDLKNGISGVEQRIIEKLTVEVRDSKEDIIVAIKTSQFDVLRNDIKERLSFNPSGNNNNNINSNNK